jgi:hypothetical protein
MHIEKFKHKKSFNVELDQYLTNRKRTKRNEKEITELLTEGEDLVEFVGA